MIIKRDISQTLSNIRNDVARKKDRRLKAVDAPVQSESVCHSSPQNLPNQPALLQPLLSSKKPPECRN